MRDVQPEKWTGNAAALLLAAAVIEAVWLLEGSSPKVRGGQVLVAVFLGVAAVALQGRAVMRSAGHRLLYALLPVTCLGVLATIDFSELLENGAVMNSAAAAVLLLALGRGVTRRSP
ncbi:MAG: hypothetical protein AAF389_03625 [Gemmatimonadota bacterium]